jgi:integrase
MAHIKRYKISVGCANTKAEHPVPKGKPHFERCTGELRYQVRWREQSEGTIRYKKETFKRYEDARASIRDRDPNANHAASKRTFDSYADDFLRLAPDEEWRRRTIESHADALKHARRYFGGKPVAKIQPADCRHFREWLDSEACPTIRTRRSIEWAYQALRAVLDLAVQDRAIPANPAATIRKPKSSGVRRERFQGHFLTKQEVEDIATQLNPPYGFVVLFLAYTGIRAGELAGLDVGDVRILRDGEGVVGGGVVSISKTRHLVKGEWLTEAPKSEKSRRKIKLLGWLAEELANYLENVHLHGSNPDAPLFPHRRNGGNAHGEPDWSQPIEPGTFYRNIFKPAVRRAGLENVRLHDLRHTCASICSRPACRHTSYPNSWGIPATRSRSTFMRAGSPTRRKRTPWRDESPGQQPPSQSWLSSDNDSGSSGPCCACRQRGPLLSWARDGPRTCGRAARPSRWARRLSAARAWTGGSSPVGSTGLRRVRQSGVLGYGGRVSWSTAGSRRPPWTRRVMRLIIRLAMGFWIGDSVTHQNSKHALSFLTKMPVYQPHKQCQPK